MGQEGETTKRSINIELEDYKSTRCSSSHSSVISVKKMRVILLLLFVPFTKVFR